MPHHRIWISRKALEHGHPAVIVATFPTRHDAEVNNSPGEHRVLTWHDEFEVPAGARVVQDPDGPKGRKVWIEWDSEREEPAP